MKKLPRVKKDAGFYLRTFCAHYDLTHEQAARMVGITASHWSLLESGRRVASPTLAAKLVELTGAPLELFLGIRVTR